MLGVDAIARAVGQSVDDMLLAFCGAVLQGFGDQGRRSGSWCDGHKRIGDLPRFVSQQLKSRDVATTLDKVFNIPRQGIAVTIERQSDVQPCGRRRST